MPTSDAGQGERGLRAGYERRVAALREQFDQDKNGSAAVRARSAAVDEVVRELWAAELAEFPDLIQGVALIALGGYGRQELFPFSDVDLLFCTGKSPSREAGTALRRISQRLWDCGLRASVSARKVADLECYRSSDPEGSLALLDLRCVAGDPVVCTELTRELQERRSTRDARRLTETAAQLTRQRHDRAGHTLFHLEPNIKDAPGGLRDAHVTLWLAKLGQHTVDQEPFEEALRFLTSVRVFLHLRHGRDDNTLDWHAQDEAAEQAVGVASAPSVAKPILDAAYWMRLYFRHARAVQRALDHELELAGQRTKPPREALRVKAPPRSGFTVDQGVLALKQRAVDLDPAADPEIVLGAFGLIAETGIRLQASSEDRISAAIPVLSSTLEDGPLMWTRLRRILSGRYAADALRSMHALGMLDLLVPEFHGIDTLVIRDAYHRYTVDEHTFVLLESLHALADTPPAGAPAWRLRFRHLLRDLPHPELLYLAALLHDTGKGRSTTDHARASAELADSVTRRLELEPFDAALVARLIDLHLEMSTALRRDIFDSETVRVFAEKVGTHDLLRMLTLFTFADISAVHPDALTPWKAENLWRLWMSAENQLDRSVDQDRVHGAVSSSAREAASIAKSLQLRPEQRPQLEQFLEGAPERYLRTRSPETIRQHMVIAGSESRVHVLLESGPGSHEVTVLTADRPRLFADLTGALAGWGMNIVSAEAFANAHGTVIDTFRFTDPYRTLALNPEEHERFRSSLESVTLGILPIDRLLSGRARLRSARPRRVVATSVEFDNMSSAASTLMQVVAQDTPGLLHRISLVLSDFGCSVEVALIDTEGEMAIDVFYVKLAGDKLDEAHQLQVRNLLVAGI